MKLTEGNRSTRRKTCPSATLSTINPPWTDPGSNPGLRGGRPAANRLSHGAEVNNNWSYTPGTLSMSSWNEDKFRDNQGQIYLFVPQLSRDYLVPHFFELTIY
jgi:hypothetical protein